MSDYIFDVRGLVSWASLTGNESSAVAEAVSDGRILILTRVWHEFQDMYPDEAGTLAAAALPRARITESDRLAAAALADHVDATFGAYDDGVDWVVAGRSLGEDLTVITSEPCRSEFYGKFADCKAICINDVLDLL